MKLKASLILALVIAAFAAAAFLFTPIYNDGYSISAHPRDFTVSYPEVPALRSFTVFVGGNVENEGFYEVPVGITYSQLFALSGFHETAGYNLSAVVAPSVTLLLSGSCCNINYSDYNHLLIYTESPEIARAIANYIAKVGGTNNKYDLVENGVLTQSEFNSVKNRIYALIQ